jgi:tetratricopeptide (TPR) repeat protein
MTPARLRRATLLAAAAAASLLPAAAAQGATSARPVVREARADGPAGWRSSRRPVALAHVAAGSSVASTVVRGGQQPPDRQSPPPAADAHEAGSAGGQTDGVPNRAGDPSPSIAPAAEESGVTPPDRDQRERSSQSTPGGGPAQDSSSVLPAPMPAGDATPTNPSSAQGSEVVSPDRERRPPPAVPADLADYVRARVADGDGAVEVASAAYARAFAAAPADPVVARHVFAAAVRAGDLSLADRAARDLAGTGEAPDDAALLALAAAATTRDTAAADAALTRLAAGPLASLAPALRGWAAFDARRDPQAALSPLPTDAVARRFVEEARALALVARGEVDAGLAALRPLLTDDRAGLDNRLAAARLLTGRGRRDAAAALLDGTDPSLIALRQAARDRPARPSLAFGAALLFTRVASDLASGPPSSLSFTLLQAALRADPRHDRARLLLAAALAKDGAVDRALATLRDVPDDSAFARTAATWRIQILADAGRTAEALDAATQLAAGPAPESDAVRRLADLHADMDRPDLAAPLYRLLLDRAGTAATGAMWLRYGAALDQAGQWPAARDALDRAVALAPDDPFVLNYLGYSLIDHGERVAAAQAMLVRAAAMRPDDPAIADSLGWAWFRRGDVARALPLIEGAAAAAPGDAEIGEHLGDLYWRLGRRFEARYAWTAARQAATGAAADRLARKVADGL